MAAQPEVSQAASLATEPAALATLTEYAPAASGGAGFEIHLLSNGGLVVAANYTKVFGDLAVRDLDYKFYDCESKKEAVTSLLERLELDFAFGIPNESRTLVVVPTMLTLLLDAHPQWTPPPHLRVILLDFNLAHDLTLHHQAPPHSPRTR